MDDANREINPHHKIGLNKAERDNTILWQMEQWSVLSNMVIYIQYDRHPMNFYNLDITSINQKRHKKIHNTEEERQML